MNKTVGIIGTGDMGSAVGRALKDTGYRVVTSLDGRSSASRALAEAAGLEDLGSLERVLDQCDVFLSILPPASAFEFGRRAARIIAAGVRELVYADCNAVAPATMDAIAECFAEGPASVVDVGIVGPPPRLEAADRTRFYVSGATRQSLLSLDSSRIRMIDMGDSIGRASAIKMCYAAMNKGVDALYANLLLAARQLGVESELMRELEESQVEAARRMARRIPFLAATSERFSGEMGEIAAAFEAAGVSGEFYKGAQWLYGLLARSSLASETRATLPKQRALDEALAVFAAALESDRNGTAGRASDQDRRVKSAPDQV